VVATAGAPREGSSGCLEGSGAVAACRAGCLVWEEKWGCLCGWSSLPYKVHLPSFVWAFTPTKHRLKQPLAPGISSEEKRNAEKK